MSKTPEEMAEKYADTWNEDPEYRIAYDSFIAGYKAGFEIGCMKGSMAMQWTLDSDWHFTPSVNHQKLADQMTKKEMKNK